jgi:hypothetical protein
MLKPEEIVGTCGQLVLYQRLIVEHSFRTFYRRFYHFCVAKKDVLNRFIFKH